MKEKFKTLPMKEYERLLQLEDLSHRQRFTIKSLEKKLDRYKANASDFANKTLTILINSGYSFADIIQLYQAEKIYDATRIKEDKYVKEAE